MICQTIIHQNDKKSEKKRSKHLVTGRSKRSESILLQGVNDVFEQILVRQEMELLQDGDLLGTLGGVLPMDQLLVTGG